MKVALVGRTAGLQAQLAEERGLGAALAASRAQCQAQARAREAAFRQQISELQEQLRDLMFFVEARSKLQAVGADSGVTREEVAGASVALPPPAPPAPHTSHKPRRKRR